MISLKALEAAIKQKAAGSFLGQTSKLLTIICIGAFLLAIVALLMHEAMVAYAVLGFLLISAIPLMWKMIDVVVKNPITSLLDGNQTLICPLL